MLLRGPGMDSAMDGKIGILALRNHAPVHVWVAFSFFDALVKAKCYFCFLNVLIMPIRSAYVFRRGMIFFSLPDGRGEPLVEKEDRIFQLPRGPRIGPRRKR